MDFIEAAEAAIARGQIYAEAKRLVELVAAFSGAPTDRLKRWSVRQLNTLIRASLEAIETELAATRDGVLSATDRQLISAVVLDARSTIG